MIFFLMKNATTELAKLNSTHILLRNVYFWLTYVKVYGFSYHAKSYCYHFSSFKVSPSYIDWNKVICGRILNWLRELTFVSFSQETGRKRLIQNFCQFSASRRSPVKWVRSHRLQKVRYMASWSMFYTHNSRWLNPFLDHDHISSGLIFDLV